jgi:hypothetical protein
LAIRYPLREVDAATDDLVELFDHLDAFGHHDHREVLGELADRRDDPALDRVCVHVAGERHVDLHDVRSHPGEVREPCVASAQVVDGDAVAEGPQLREPPVHVVDALERLALGQLEHHAARVAGERRVQRVQLRVRQVCRVQVDEERTLWALRAHLVGDELAHVTPKRV